MRTNEFQVLVNWGDTDVAGIVYYPNFFKWFDIAGHEFFRKADLAPSKLLKERSIILPMLDARCTFENALYYEDVLTIRSSVSEINNKTIKLSHDIFRGETRAGTGYELRGWVEKRKDDKIKAVPIPKEVRDILMDEVAHNRYVNETPRLNA